MLLDMYTAIMVYSNATVGVFLGYAVHVQLLLKIFINSDICHNYLHTLYFLSVCNKLLLCLRYDLFLLLYARHI